MRFAKGFALVLAIAGAVALGVWIGPYITHREATVADTTSSATQTPMASVEKDRTARDARHARGNCTTRERGAQENGRRNNSTDSVGATPRSIPAAAPALTSS
jgi:hypothetical protein